MDLANHLGNIPTSVKVDVAGADLDAVLMPGFLREQLTHFGYTRVKADLAAKIDWSEAKKTTTVNGLKLSVKDVGTVTADAVLGGPARADVEQLDSFAALQSFLPKLSLVSGTLSFKDESIVGRVIADQATGAQGRPGQVPRPVRARPAVHAAAGGYARLPAEGGAGLPGLRAHAGHGDLHGCAGDANPLAIADQRRERQRGVHVADTCSTCR